MALVAIGIRKAAILQPSSSTRRSTLQASAATFTLYDCPSLMTAFRLSAFGRHSGTLAKAKADCSSRFPFRRQFRREGDLTV
jgi:hypothetical protein